MCIAVFTLDAGLLARSQYSKGPATSHLDTGFSWFSCVYKQMLRWFSRFQVATVCFSCSPPELNLLVTNFICCIHVKLPLPPGDNQIAVYYYYYYCYYYHYHYLLYAGVFIHIFLRQTMSLGNTVFQLFCHYYLWCLYR